MPEDKLDSFVLKPVGYVSSEYKHYTDVLNRHTRRGWTEDFSKIILYPQHAAKLKGLDNYSHIIVLYWIHRSGEWRIPKNHSKPPYVKLFATRMPVRPNPIGLSVVELIDFSPKTGEVKVKGLDALDKTPVVDIKPYIPALDSFSEASVPHWIKKHLDDHHNHTHND